MTKLITAVLALVLGAVLMPLAAHAQTDLKTAIGDLKYEVGFGEQLGGY